MGFLYIVDVVVMIACVGITGSSTWLLFKYHSLRKRCAKLGAFAMHHAMHDQAADMKRIIGEIDKNRYTTALITVAGAALGIYKAMVVGLI